MYKYTYKATFFSEEDIKKFEESFKTEIIQNGLDSILKTDIKELKTTLRDYINRGIRNISETPAESAKKGSINIPKSDEAILQQLTGLNIADINRTKNDISSVASSTCIVRRDQKGDPYVRLAIPVGVSDTIGDQFNKAKEFFNKALFVNNERSGHTQYLLNAGIDLTKYIKLVCTTDTGITEASTERLEDYKKRPNGLATWTLTQEGVKLITDANKGFQDLTEAIDSIKKGNNDTASKILKIAAIKNTNQHEFINTMAANLKKPENPTGTSTFQEYQEVLKLINAIYIQKTMGETIAVYTAYTTTTMDETTNANLFTELQKMLRLWVLNHEEKWVRKFLNKVKKLLRKHVETYRKVNV